MSAPTGVISITTQLDLKNERAGSFRPLEKSRADLLDNFEGITKMNFYTQDLWEFFINAINFSWFILFGIFFVLLQLLEWLNRDLKKKIEGMISWKGRLRILLGILFIGFFLTFHKVKDEIRSSRMETEKLGGEVLGLNSQLSDAVSKISDLERNYKAQRNSLENVKNDGGIFTQGQTGGNNTVINQERKPELHRIGEPTIRKNLNGFTTIYNIRVTPYPGKLNITPKAESLIPTPDGQDNVACEGSMMMSFKGNTTIVHNPSGRCTVYIYTSTYERGDFNYEFTE